MLTEGTFFDLVEMARLAHEKYGWPDMGDSGSFHHAIQQGEHGQDTLAWVEMPDESDSDDALVENYGEDYAKALRTMQQMVKDGELPDKSEFRILVWW